MELNAGAGLLVEHLGHECQTHSHTWIRAGPAKGWRRERERGEWDEGRSGGGGAAGGWRQQVLEMKRAMGIWPDYKCCAIAQTWLKKLYHTKMVFDSKWITSVGDLRKSSEFFFSSSFRPSYTLSSILHSVECLDWKRIYKFSVATQCLGLCGPHPLPSYGVLHPPCAIVRNAAQPKYMNCVLRCICITHTVIIFLNKYLHKQ